MKKSNSFTLIELLVVISVIAVLMAILLPSLNSAKKRAKQLICMNNMRNLGAITALYSTDHDENLLGYSTLWGVGGSREPWFKQLFADDYISIKKDWNWLYCISWTTPYMFDGNGRLVEPRYGMNKLWSSFPDTVIRKLSTMRNPSTMDYFADSIYQPVPLSDIYLIQSYYYNPSDIESVKIHMRHFRASNFWFLDGHSASLMQSALQESPRTYDISLGSTATYRNFYY